MKKRLISCFCSIAIILSFISSVSISNIVAHAYNSNAAITYAHTYWSNYNSNYSNYNPDGGDCANFVSQCLVAGGLPMTDGWYWKSYNNHSDSWTYCPSMYSYFKNSGYQIIVNPTDSQIIEGNPVLYYSASKDRWSHAAICTGHDSSGNALISAHNTDHIDVNWKLGSGWSKRCTIIINGGISSHNPEGYLDEAVGGEGSVYLRGWTLDRDAPNESLNVHIYMDGGAGVGKCITGDIIADKPRDDVNSALGVGGNHGFEATITGIEAGTHTFYAYGINKGGGENAQLINVLTATVSKEASPPVISDIAFSDVSPSGYTVSCKVTDNIGVSKVQFPSWSENNGQDDIIWGDGTESGGIYSYRVNISDHNNDMGTYSTHIYATDTSGNVVSAGVVIVLEDVKPEISDISITDVSKDGYTVNCCVTDEIGEIDSVLFPSWTTSNDQDDIIWGKGTYHDGIYSYRVNVAEHNGEIGQYLTHIYAYDKCGNYSAKPARDSSVYTKENQGVYLEDEAPSLTNAEIIEITPTSYTIRCEVNDTESGINRVQFPSWTVNADQDDIQPEWECNMEASGVIVGNTVTYTVNISDHNLEKGPYVTHIYAYDNCGNCKCYGKLESITLPEYGDVNLDGTVSVADIVALQKWLLNCPDAELKCWQAADLCEDGVINVFDLSLMKRMLISQ